MTTPTPLLCPLTPATLPACPGCGLPTMGSDLCALCGAQPAPHPLAPARGILLGLALGTGFWGLLALVWQVVRHG